MNYIILRSLSREGLEREVNEYLQRGYIPAGGICYAEDGFWQAVWIER